MTACLGRDVRAYLRRRTAITITRIARTWPGGTGEFQLGEGHGARGFVHDMPPLQSARIGSILPAAQKRPLERDRVAIGGAPQPDYAPFPGCRWRLFVVSGANRMTIIPSA
jgi:hypothetical protein